MAVYAVSRPSLVRNVEITRLRAFPSVGEMFVTPGSIVDRSTVLGQYASRQRLRMVRVEASGDRISATVLVAAGQKVKRGEVLAYYSYLFGLGYTEYTSPCDGEVVDIVQATGQILIKESPSEIACHLSGTAQRVDEAMGVWVRSRGDFVGAIAGAGFARSGRLVKKTDRPTSQATVQSIGPDDAGKVVLAGSSVSQEFIEACLRYRVAGIIAGSAGYRVFQWYKELAASLDWDEFLARYWARELKSKDAVVPRPTEIVPALVLTEGFGEIPMPDAVFDLLASHEGEDVFVDGAGALEPDVAAYLDAGPCVITAPSQVASQAGESEAGDQAALASRPAPERGSLKQLAPGTRVRVTSLTGPSTLGIVEGVPEEDIVLPNGITVPGVTVVTDKGEHLAVPALNIEVIGP